MTVLESPPPRSYWLGLSDHQLEKAIAEYTAALDAGLLTGSAARGCRQTVADMADDLARRSAYRDALADGKEHPAERPD